MVSLANITLLVAIVTAFVLLAACAAAASKFENRNAEGFIPPPTLTECIARLGTPAGHARSESGTRARQGG